MIDKSMRQWYASGQLVKKGAIGTRPGFRGPHGSGPGAPGGPSGPSGPSGGHHGGGHHAPSPSPRPAPTPSPTPSPHKDPVVTRAPDWVTGGSKPSPTTTPSTLGGDNKVDVGFQEVLRKQKIVEDLKKQTDEDFGFEDIKVKAPTTFKPKTKTITIHGKDGSYTKEQPIKYSPTHYQDRSKIGGKTYGERAEDAISRGIGFGGILKGLGTAAASTLLPMFLPAKLAAGVKMYNTAKTVSTFAKKYGITETDVVQSLTSNIKSNLNKDILKQTKKDDIPKVADRHPGTGKKKRTYHEGKGDGVSRILPESLQSSVSEGTQQFLSDEMKEQYTVAQNKMKAALASGYYIDQNGKQIELDDEQVNALTQWITKIDSMLVDPVTMADGGRVDKALGGRVRDI